MTTKRSWAGLIAAIATFWSVSAQATVVTLYQFDVTRNGVMIFSDGFGDGNPPPSAPAFSNGASASYAARGSFPSGSEANASLTLDTANGALTTNALGQARLDNGATLLTPMNTSSPNSLGIGNTIEVSGLFSLTTPVGPLINGFNIQVGNLGSASGVQLAELQVRFDPVSGLPQIRYILQNFQANTITQLGAVTFAPPSGAEAILLDIRRSDTRNNDFIASWEFWKDDAPIAGSGGSFSNAAALFQTDNWVRGRFLVFTAVPEPATLALLGLGLVGLATMRRRRANG